MLSVGKGRREPGLCILLGDPKLIQVFWKATGNMYQKPENGHSLTLHTLAAENSSQGCNDASNIDSHVDHTLIITGEYFEQSKCLTRMIPKK